jgi:elongation factor G
LSGYPLGGIKVRLVRATMRQEDSTEMAFKIAASMAFRQACEKCRPAIMEPFMKLEVTVPSDFLGPVINDLNARRGKVASITARKDIQVIDVEAPLAEMFGYATALRSMSQGRASYTMQFDRFERMAGALQKELLRRIGR